jgi:hypothetical protein
MEPVYLHADKLKRTEQLWLEIGRLQGRLDAAEIKIKQLEEKLKKEDNN